MLGIQETISLAIQKEREYQDKKYGGHSHTIAEWILIMEKELHEAKKAYFQNSSNEHMMAEILQVVAVGVACMEEHGSDYGIKTSTKEE